MRNRARGIHLAELPLELADPQLQHLVFPREHLRLGLVEGGFVARGRRGPQQQFSIVCARAAAHGPYAWAGVAAGGCAAPVGAVSGERGGVEWRVRAQSGDAASCLGRGDVLHGRSGGCGEGEAAL